MADTDKTLANLTKKDDGSMASVWKGLPQRSVIWFLITALAVTIWYIGSGMHSRLEALEQHKSEQNGTLRHMSETLIKLETNVEWIKAKVDR